MSTVRWTFLEIATNEIYTVPINPDSMSSPFSERQLQTSYGSRAGGNRLRTNELPSAAKEWEFGGVIRTKQHHDDLARWAKKPGIIHVSDHLGRTFQVMFTAFDPTDRSPTPSTPWRLRYTMTALVLRRLA